MRETNKIRNHAAAAHYDKNPICLKLCVISGQKQVSNCIQITTLMKWTIHLIVI